MYSICVFELFYMDVTGRFFVNYNLRGSSFKAELRNN